jgi:hypothetical protein
VYVRLPNRLTPKLTGMLGDFALRHGIMMDIKLGDLHPSMPAPTERRTYNPTLVTWLGREGGTSQTPVITQEAIRALVKREPGPTRLQPGTVTRLFSVLGSNLHMPGLVTSPGNEPLLLGIDPEQVDTLLCALGSEQLRDYGPQMDAILRLTSTHIFAQPNTDAGN